MLVHFGLSLEEITVEVRSVTLVTLLQLPLPVACTGSASTLGLASESGSLRWGTWDLSPGGVSVCPLAALGQPGPSPCIWPHSGWLPLVTWPAGPSVLTCKKGGWFLSQPALRPKAQACAQPAGIVWAVAEIFGLGSWTGGTTPVTGGLGGSVQPPRPHLPQLSMHSAGRGLTASGGGEFCGKARGWVAGPASPPSNENVYKVLPVWQIGNNEMMSQTVVSRCVQFHVNNCRSLGLGVELKSKTIHDTILERLKNLLAK